MKYKESIKIVMLIFVVSFASEIVNFLSQPGSPSSVYINNYFINKSIYYSKSGDFNNSVKHLHFASCVNIFSEFNRFRNKMPKNFCERISFPEDSVFRNEIMNYIGGLVESDLINGRDQGLGKIYYNLALISYRNKQMSITEKLFKKALYNLPEYAVFHTELINFYFTKNDLLQVTSGLDYCSNFEKAKGLCELYKKNDLDGGRPRDVGFMRDIIEDFYTMP